MENIKIITDLPVERWEEYKKLKIEAIKDSPQAFSHELSEAENETDEYWKNGLGANNIKVFAESDGKLIGMVGGRFYSKEMFKHNAVINSFYVNKNHRGKGLGELLEKTAIEKIEQNPIIINVLCEVSSTQTASLAIQKKLGFEICGTIKDYGFFEGKYIDDIQLLKRIR
jgi:L-amino acid N-acyltransferase YncA